MAGFSMSSAERCLAIVELLAGHPDGLPLTTISATLNLPQSATHRLLSVLEQRGYVGQHSMSGWYFPTLVIAALGIRLLSSLDIPNICQPILNRIAEQTCELVRLAVVEGERMLWIAKAQGCRSSLRYDPTNGRDVPLHTTAMGKAWLATLPEDEAVALVLRQGFGWTPIGPHAIHDETSLRTELKVTRARGYGLVDEEAEPGISAIGVIVRNGSLPDSPPVAALSIGGPSFRLDPARLESYAPLLREAAHALSRIWPVRAFHKAQSAA